MDVANDTADEVLPGGQPIESEIEWLQQMAGRRLKPPKCKPLLSLPEWMLKSSDVRQGRARCQKGALPELQPIIPSVEKKSNRLSASRRLSTMLSRLEKRGSDERLGDSENVAISSELQRRKRLHPRLRWPRLAKNTNGSIMNVGITNVNPEDDADQSKQESPIIVATKVFTADDLDPKKGLLTPDVIGPDSLFYPGELLPTEPDWNRVKWTKESGPPKTAPDLPANPPLLPRIGRNLGGSGDTTKVGQQPSSSRPALLTRAQPSTELAVGNSATVHLPRLDGTFLDHRSRARKGASCPTDRKYLLRQAPFSHIMARDLAAPADTRTRGSSSSLTKTRKAECNPRSEYINFEGWGIDDDYIEMLCKKTDLAKIKFMNFSDNRLTEQGIIFMMAHHGDTTWALENLQFAKNNLEELGGSTLARFLDTIRPSLRELDMSENLIGDKAGIELCDALCARCPFLHGLILAGNELGRIEKMGTSLARLIENSRELEVLDLHWNLFHGASATQVFNGLYENNVQLRGKLRRLNLAWNRLGMRCSGSDRMIQRLAAIFKDGQVLFHLDLSYNGLCAENCGVLAVNLRHNHTLFGLHLNGNEATVDELGFVIPSVPDQAIKTVETQDKLNRLAENIPSKLRLDMTPLVIAGREVLDRATKGSHSVAEKFRRIRTVEPKAMEEKPKLRHSQFSILSEGTDVRVSDVAPELGLFGGYRANPSLRGLSNQLGGDNQYPVAFSKEDMQLEKEWVKARSLAQQSLRFGLTQGGESHPQRNAQCCWICENWIEQRVSYIPGWSGPEISADEVVSVSAFFSIDGFTRPTKLVRVDEPYQRRLFDSERSGRLRTRKFGRRENMNNNVCKSVDTLGRKANPCLTEQGRVVRWTGCRMLPPTTLPIHIVFQVNDRVVTADDLPTKSLQVPKAIRMHPMENASKADVTTSSSWMKCDPMTSVAGSCNGNSDPLVVEVDHINTVTVGVSAWDRFELGDATALIILEDPDRRGEINVLPRRMGEVHTPQADTAWSFDKSEFIGYSTDTADTGTKLFDYDFKMTKLESSIRDANVKENLCAFMRAHYVPLVMAFRHYAFFGFRSRQHAAGLVLMAFTDLMADYGGTSGDAIESDRNVGARTGARKTQATARPASSQTQRATPPPTGDPLFKRTFLSGIADTVFIASSVIDKERRRVLLGMPDKGLARYQFLEAFVRIAQRRFQDSGEEEDVLGAVKALWRMTSMGQNLLDLRRSLHKHLFCEECDLVFKEYRHMLEGVYLAYKDLFSYPGRMGTGLSYGAWEQMLQDAKMDEVGVSIREAGVAFAIGKELRLDEYSSMRHMELSWSEFLVCLGATMMLRVDWESEFFADMLADFFADNLSNARQSRFDPAAYGSQHSHNDLNQVLQLVSKVFLEADEDSSGTLSVREFRICMTQPQVQQEMKDIGFAGEELSTMFSTIDKDHSGEVTLDELCEGFIKMKLSMRGTDRSIAYFRKAFAEADLDGNGTLSMEEFSALCSNQKVLKRLGALGVQVGEVETLFDTLSLKKGGKAGDKKNRDTLALTADDMIAGFLAIRDVGLGESRGVNFLRQIFLEADTDNSSTLSREEMQRAFCTEKVAHKLQRLHLKEPDWMDIFDALDADGNGDISWSELSQGVCQLWKQAIDEDVAIQAKSMSETVANVGKQPAPTKTATGALTRQATGLLTRQPTKGLSSNGSTATLTPATSFPSLAAVSPMPSPNP